MPQNLDKMFEIFQKAERPFSNGIHVFVLCDKIDCVRIQHKGLQGLLQHKQKLFPGAIR